MVQGAGLKSSGLWLRQTKKPQGCWREVSVVHVTRFKGHELTNWRTLCIVRTYRYSNPCEGGLQYPCRNPDSRRWRKENPIPGGITGPPCHWGAYIQGLCPTGWWSDARLKTLFCRNDTVAMPKGVTTGRNLAECCKEGHGSNRIVLQMMIVMVVVVWWRRLETKLKRKKMLVLRDMKIHIVFQGMTPCGLICGNFPLIGLVFRIRFWLVAYVPRMKKARSN